MSYSNPANLIPRQSIEGMEGMWVKIWDPPTASPSTPDKLEPTNPVPEVMHTASLQSKPSLTHTVQRDGLHGAQIWTWDSQKRLVYYLWRDKDNAATGSGNFPGATIRIPRGVIFHGEAQGHGPPPHTIHWHGIEPTPMNDGVGHCSMEIGHYTYQFQPNFIGFYFAHCHRNTVQHFEFGLYQALLIDPPDAYFATQWDRGIPIGAGRDGKRRIAANLTGTPLAALQDNFNPLTAPDPEANNASLPAYLKFATDPHAMTVPYDVEALWVVDDRDSRWSEMAPDARATYPKHGNIPGVDDNFHGNAGGGVGPNDFFAFNQFNADYWFVTGVPVPAHKGEVGTIPAGIAIPPALICGTATQVSIEAKVGQTILVRCLNAAYNNVTYRFPVDVTVIAWDGRALGVPPYGHYNHAYTIPAGEPIHASVARRFDCLIKSDVPLSDFATVEFLDTRHGTAADGRTGTATDAQNGAPGNNPIVLCTAKIPINIGYAVSGRVTNQATGFGVRGVTVAVSGAASKTAVTDELGNYNVVGLPAGDYTVAPSLSGHEFTPASTAVTLPSAAPVNFVAAQLAGAYSISGLLYDSRGGGSIGGTEGAQANARATVTLTGGAAPVTVAADSHGRFMFTGLANGEYVVTPTSPAYSFRPGSKTVIINGANRSVNFRGSLIPMAH